MKKARPATAPHLPWLKNFDDAEALFAAHMRVRARYWLSSSAPEKP